MRVGDIVGLAEGVGETVCVEAIVFVGDQVGVIVGVGVKVGQLSVIEKSSTQKVPLAEPTLSMVI